MDQIATPISRLFATPRGADNAVATNSNGQILWSSFRLDVATLATRLIESDNDRWLVAETDAYALAVGVFATLHAGAKAVLPANLQEGHLRELAATVNGVISSTVYLPEATSRIKTFEVFKAGGALALQPLDPEAAEIVLHTSGTTGAPASVRKTLRCLEAEIVSLNGIFNPEPGKLVLATVPPYHIYGLLFRVLWPLATGRPFSAGLISYPEELRAATEKNPGSLLVSSPAFLKRALPIVDVEHLGHFLGPAFSSGGLLPPRIAAIYNRSLPASLTEVYGSTETGGIGYRTVTKETAPEPWQALPGVEVTVDPVEGTLSVKSPFLMDKGWHTTGDRASIGSDGKFVLNGRSDRMVKIEEVRVSLSEVERRLIQCSTVETARVIRLLFGDTKRQILAAVIVPSPVGWEALQTDGRRIFRHQLLGTLSPYLAPVALPRKWCFVTQIPEDDRGKSTEMALAKLFQNDQDRMVRPVISESKIERDEATFNLQLPQTLSYFEGHYEEVPILAGVVQIDWAISFAVDNFSITENFRRIEVLKFFKILTPGDQITLALEWNLKTGRLKFEYQNAGTKYSSGRIIFGEAV